jgi:hypothetical protein
MSPVINDHGKGAGFDPVVAQNFSSWLPSLIKGLLGQDRGVAD